MLIVVNKFTLLLALILSSRWVCFAGGQFECSSFLGKVYIPSNERRREKDLEKDPVGDLCHQTRDLIPLWSWIFHSFSWNLISFYCAGLAAGLFFSVWVFGSYVYSNFNHLYMIDNKDRQLDSSIISYYLYCFCMNLYIKFIFHFPSLNLPPSPHLHPIIARTAWLCWHVHLFKPVFFLGLLSF